MRAPLLLLALHLALPAAVFAVPVATDCKEFGAIGCYYASKDNVAPGMPVILYLRGWWGVYDGQVPQAKCLESARQAFMFYGLGAAADSAKAAILVTCSSHIGLTLADLGDLQRAVGASFYRTIIASHSGGYVGLDKTLAGGVVPNRLLMLDNFYFEPSFSDKVSTLLFGGTGCAGFYTAHNKTRYEKNFKSRVSCTAEYHEDFGHDAAVNKCLGAYLSGAACP